VSSTRQAFFATVGRGTESVLAEELGELGAEDVEQKAGGVKFEADLEGAYRVCVGSRVASRLVMPLTTFEATDADSLYAGAAGVRWTDHLGPEATFAVSVAGKGPAGPGKFVALKVKDAIVDTIRDAEGSRPSVDKVEPGLRIHVHLGGQTVTVSVDLAGRGLHKRGVGRSGGAAPLKENLAAALLRIAGWHRRGEGERILVDPFCGSGTFLIEAAWMSRDVAPGLMQGFGAPGWRGHDALAWERVIAEARERRDAGREVEIAVHGFDGSADAVTRARQNVERAGVSSGVRVTRCALADLEAPEGPPGLLVANPPYGERLGEAGELGPLYAQLGDALKRRFPGWSAWVLSGNRALDKRIGLKAASRHPVMNGPIDCRFLELPIGAEAPTSEGPGWRKASKESEMFANRLRKNEKRVGRWARRQGITAYRIYDADIPEFNVAVDWYDGAVRVEEYRRPKKVAANLADRRIEDVLIVVPEVLGVDPEDVVLRVRGRREAGAQEERRADLGHLRTVREGDEVFLVNLDDYLDTGLFLDDRAIRRRIREGARDKRFLNLFCYTCTASVAAAAGGARTTTSVDLSNRYLDWGRENFEANGLAKGANRFVRADVLAWLSEHVSGRERWDQILLAPPTYSKSKSMSGDFDVQRDHVRLIRDTASLLAAGGELIFTTNLRTFALDEAALGGLGAREITAEITPEDFRKKPRIRAYRFGPSS